VRLAAGPQSYLPALIDADLVMRPKDGPRAASEAACQSMIEQGIWIAPDDTLETALPLFEREGHAFLPVAERGPGEGETVLLGALFHVDALRAYNRALAEAAEEEHS
jgi:CIC family chloride channel protein